METTSVKITREANDAMQSVRRQTGVGKIELMSRLALWFANQDPTLRAVILGQVAEQDALPVIDLIKARYESQDVAALQNNLRDVAGDHKAGDKSNAGGEAG